jgi:hypothetical protein
MLFLSPYSDNSKLITFSRLFKSRGTNNGDLQCYSGRKYRIDPIYSRAAINQNNHTNPHHVPSEHDKTRYVDIVRASEDKKKRQQEYKSENALRKLAVLIKYEAKVIRNNKVDVCPSAKRFSMILNVGGNGKAYPPLVFERL